MAAVNKSGFSEYQTYDYEAESKKGKANKKEKADKHAGTAKNAGKTAKLFGEAVAVGAENFGGESGVGVAATARQLGESAERAGNGAAAGVQLANSENITAAGASTLALAREAQGLQKDATANDSAFTKAGQNKAYSDAAKKEGAKEERLTDANDRYYERQHKKNPEAFKADGSVNKDSPEGQKIDEHLTDTNKKIQNANDKAQRYKARAAK